MVQANFGTSNIQQLFWNLKKIDDIKLIGATILKNINLINCVSEFAYILVIKKKRGKGYSKNNQ